MLASQSCNTKLPGKDGNFKDINFAHLHFNFTAFGAIDKLSHKGLQQHGTF